MKRQNLVNGFVVAALVVSAALLAWSPIGAQAQQKYPGIRPGFVELFLNSSQDQRLGAKLAIYGYEDQIAFVNFVTETAINGTDITTIPVTIEGMYAKIALADINLEGWYGNNGEQVDLRSVSRFKAHSDGVMVIARNGAYTMTLKSGDDIDLDTFGINEQVDWLLWPIDPVVPATNTPQPTVTAFFPSPTPQLCPQLKNLTANGFNASADIYQVNSLPAGQSTYVNWGDFTHTAAITQDGRIEHLYDINGTYTVTVLAFDQRQDETCRDDYTLTVNVLTATPVPPTKVDVSDRGNDLRLVLFYTNMTPPESISVTTDLSGTINVKWADPFVLPAGWISFDPKAGLVEESSPFVYTDGLIVYRMKKTFLPLLTR